LASLNPYTNPLGYRKAKHLLRRSCFNYSKTTLDYFSGLTPQQAVAELSVEPTLFWEHPYDTIVNPDTGVPDGFWMHTANTSPADFTFAQFRKKGIISGWWWYNAQKQNSLKHKLIFFLHSCFTVSKTDGVPKSSYFYDYLRLLEFYAYGNIKTLAKKITFDNSILYYLDNNTNNKNNPNENYAREFLELFTILKGEQIGEGDYTTYTESDIQNAAKVFSGIKTKPLRDTLDPDTQIPMGYVNTGQHDTQDKTFSAAFNNQTISGQSSQAGVIQEIDEFVEMIFSQATTAKSYCRKLYRFFVKSEWGQDVEDDIITPLSNQLIANDFNLLDVLSTLLNSQHFYDQDNSDNSDEIIGSIVKSPLQLISELIRILNISLPNPEASASNPPTSFSGDQINFHKFYYNFAYLSFFPSSGINPFSPDSVAGYPAMYQSPSFDRSWFSSNTVIGRYKLIECFISGKNKIANNNTNIRIQFDSVDYTENSGNFTIASDATTLIQELANLLYCEAIDSNRVDYFLSVLTDGFDASYWNSAWFDYLQTGNNVQVKIRLDALFTRMINAAEFQLM
tara:strand:+ start:2259 stop:3953 length:1695 start_codon:yes stop_codon:yes gene_type:complete